MKIGLLGNMTRKNTVVALDEIADFLKENGYTPKTFLYPDEVDGVDVVLVVGGDGAILHAAVPAAKKNIKIIGINYGTVGFLTEYEKNERERVLELLLSLEKEKSHVVKRSVLQLNVNERVFYALNEFVLQRDLGPIDDVGVSAQILSLQVETKAGSDTISGDGMLVCTPTGSTAYSLSAGGAILTPEVPVFMLTPICAFSMRARPIVFSDSDEFKITVTKGKSVVLSDGKSVANLKEGDTVCIKKAPFTADFPVKDGTDFFAKVRNKLNG